MSPDQSQPLTDLYYLRRFLGAYLAGAREQAGISLRGLEVRSGVANSEISKIERGDQDCRLETFIKVSAALGIPFGKILDDVVISEPAFYSGRLMKDVQFLKVTENYIETRSILAVNVGVIAAWVAHLIRCGNPNLRVNSVVYPSEEMRLAFVSLAELVRRFDPASRRKWIDSLSIAPVACLMGCGLFSEGILRVMIERVLSADGQHPLVDAGIQEVFGLRVKGVVWFPFFPRALDMAACSPPFFGITSSVDKVPNSEYASVVRLTWKLLKARLNKATEPRGKRAELAKAIDVYPSRLISWLDDDQEPGAEAAFRLLEWVTAEEAKLKSSQGASTPGEPKTQPKVTSNEKTKLKSGRKKK